MSKGYVACFDCTAGVASDSGKPQGAGNRGPRFSLNVTRFANSLQNGQFRELFMRTVLTLSQYRWAMLLAHSLPPTADCSF